MYARAVFHLLSYNYSDIFVITHLWLLRQAISGRQKNHHFTHIYHIYDENRGHLSLLSITPLVFTSINQCVVDFLPLLRSSNSIAEKGIAEVS